MTTKEEMIIEMRREKPKQKLLAQFQHLLEFLELLREELMMEDLLEEELLVGQHYYIPLEGYFLGN